ncbi:MAG: DUF721 domain-containing protein [Bacteroides sp.]|nr:DUF721 domain-containing protein [Bacteroides sp.]
MERTDPQCIGDILRLAFQENCMQEHLDEYRAAALWQTVVGNDIANKCHRPSVKNGIMTVGVPYASLRNELTMNRSSLRSAINGIIGKNIITEIRFTS